MGVLTAKDLMNLGNISHLEAKLPGGTNSFEAAEKD
jgi:hypothetical protein